MKKMKCWICGNNEFIRVGGNDGIILQAEKFKITDANYGVSLPRYKCCNCGFIQCNLNNVTEFYENLKDVGYIDSSNQRALQFAKLLKTVERYIPINGSILDIGAGSGLFLYEAIKMGYSATGIEPSLYLADIGKKSGLDIIRGTFPENCPDESYDAIFLTDVIEHIANPLPMLKSIPDFLAPRGKVVVTTPDISSVLSKIMGKHWWHYRVAHIGYYNKYTMKFLMNEAGLKLIKVKYATWYFSLKYITERLARYLHIINPIAIQLSDDVIITLNLFDSRIYIFEVLNNI